MDSAASRLDSMAHRPCCGKTTECRFLALRGMTRVWDGILLGTPCLQAERGKDKPLTAESAKEPAEGVEKNKFLALLGMTNSLGLRMARVKPRPSGASTFAGRRMPSHPGKLNPTLLGTPASRQPAGPFDSAQGMLFQRGVRIPRGKFPL